MTERGPATLERSANSWALGGTRWEWEGDGLTITFDEETKPFFQRMRPKLTGRVTLRPGVARGEETPLEPRGAHVWRAVAPAGTAVVEIEGGPSFSGPAYCDENAGVEGLERGFQGWNWSRTAKPDGTAVLYDVTTRAGEDLRWGRFYGKDGSVREFDPQVEVPLGSAGWRVSRRTRSSMPGGARVERTMVASPFYSRSLLRVDGNDGAHVAVHERLDITRFEAGWVRFLLPWRIRREH
jgi:carotenoid 1,2-hydratase